MYTWSLLDELLQLYDEGVKVVINGKSVLTVKSDLFEHLLPICQQQENCVDSLDTLPRWGVQTVRKSLRQVRTT